MNDQTQTTPPLNSTDLLRALEAIDCLAGDDFCEELDMSNMTRKLRGRLRMAHEKLSLIYQIAHAENSNNSCYRVHDDWRTLKESVLTDESGASSNETVLRAPKAVNNAVALSWRQWKEQNHEQREHKRISRSTGRRGAAL